MPPSGLESALVSIMNHEVSIVKPTDKLLIVAPPRIPMADVDHMCSAIDKFKSGTDAALILPHDSKLYIVDKSAEIEIHNKAPTEHLGNMINDLTLSLSMWHSKYPFDEDHIYKQKIMINNASVLIEKPRTEHELKTMLDRTPDNIMLTVEQQWASELFEELCTIKPESTPIDALEPVTERHPAVESLISQLSTILYGDENEQKD